MSLIEFFTLGTSHAVAPASVREAFALSEEGASSLLAYMSENPGVFQEAAVLATCTRTEIYVATCDAPAAEKRLRRFASGTRGLSLELQREYTYARYGRGAARHLLRVASGLDSLMLGEGQVLAQVKTARRLAEESGTSGPILGHLFDAAARCGKCVRTGTNISRGAVSVAAAAVEHAQTKPDGLEQADVLVIGGGETGSIVARLLAKKDVARIVIVNRTPERALELAAACGGEARPWSELEAVLAQVDVVFTATAAPAPVLCAEMLARALAGREDRPLRVFDLANPRDVEPSAARIQGVVVHDLDGLQSVVEQNRRRRASEVPGAERIVEHELQRFWSWFETRRVLPLLKALRASYYELGQDEVRRQLHHFDDTHREPLERFTRSLMNRLLHQPTVHIKSLDPTDHVDREKLEVLCDCFELTSGSLASASAVASGTNGDKR